MKSLEKFKGKHSGETCVVIGNGYSLKAEDLKKLSKKYVTFGSNGIYRLPFTPNYYCIIDEKMLNNCLPLPPDFKPWELFLRAEASVEKNNPIYPIVAAGFSKDIANFVVMGGTVTFAMLQIVAYMGFSTTLLIGVDHYYPKAGKLTPATEFMANGGDPDHFVTADGSPYFNEGNNYNAPELEGTTQAYEIAQQYFEQLGRRIINLTPDTHLDAFEKDKLENWK